MNWLALRFAVANRAAALIALMALIGGTFAMTVCLSVSPAIDARDLRTSWMNPSIAATSGPATYFAVQTDYFGSVAVTEVLVASDQQGAPVPPGIPRLPDDGQVYASPAMRGYAVAHPSLESRYGEIRGAIEQSALSGPDQLLVVRGVPLSLAKNSLLFAQVHGFERHTQDLVSTRFRLVLGATSAIVALPVGLVLWIALRLRAVEVRRRLRTLRTLGASRPALRRLTLIEMVPQILVAVPVGVLMFFALRPLLAQLDLGEGPSFASDFKLSALGYLMVAVLIPLLAVIVTTASTRKSIMHADAPSHIIKRSRLRLVWPAFAGLAVGAVVWAIGGVAGPQLSPALQITAPLAVAFGFSPLVILLIGQGLKRLPGRGPSFMAGSLLSSSPAYFVRAASGTCLAVLIAGAYVGLVPEAFDRAQQTSTISQAPGSAQATLFGSSQGASFQIQANIAALAGVNATALVYDGSVQTGTSAANVWIGNCAQIAAAAHLTGIPCGSAPVLISNSLGVVSNLAISIPEQNAIDSPQELDVPIGHDQIANFNGTDAIDAPSIIVDSDYIGSVKLAQFRPALLLVSYDNDRALERARTVVVQQSPAASLVSRQNAYDGFNLGLRQVGTLVTAVLVGVFALTAFGLFVLVATLQIDRQRNRATLVSLGVRESVLRRTTVLSAVIPSIATATLSLVTLLWMDKFVLYRDNPRILVSAFHGVVLPCAIGLTVSVVIGLIPVYLPNKKR